MRKLSLIVLLIFSQLTNAAEDDPTDQDSNQEIQEGDSEAVIIDITDETDRIIKDIPVSGLGAPFPVDI